MTEFERIMIMQFKEMNVHLLGINKYLSFISRDTSITENENDIGIACILNDIKKQLPIKKEGK